ncbi:hypothetical protein [Serratia fonticola]
MTGSALDEVVVENNILSVQKAETLNKSIEDQKAGKNLSQNV